MSSYGHTVSLESPIQLKRLYSHRSIHKIPIGMEMYRCVPRRFWVYPYHLNRNEKKKTNTTTTTKTVTNSIATTHGVLLCVCCDVSVCVRKMISKKKSSSTHFAELIIHRHKRSLTPFTCFIVVVVVASALLVTGLSEGFDCFANARSSIYCVFLASNKIEYNNTAKYRSVLLDLYKTERRKVRERDDELNYGIICLCL